jgi:hypothetical protein
MTRQNVIKCLRRYRPVLFIPNAANFDVDADRRAEAQEISELHLDYRARRAQGAVLWVRPVISISHLHPPTVTTPGSRSRRPTLSV